MHAVYYINKRGKLEPINLVICFKLSFIQMMIQMPYKWNHNVGQGKRLSDAIRKKSIDANIWFRTWLEGWSKYRMMEIRLLPVRSQVPHSRIRRDNTPRSLDWIRCLIRSVYSNVASTLYTAFSNIFFNKRDMHFHPISIANMSASC